MKEYNTNCESLTEKEAIMGATPQYREDLEIFFHFNGTDVPCGSVIQNFDEKVETLQVNKGNLVGQFIIQVFGGYFLEPSGTCTNALAESGPNFFREYGRSKFQFEESHIMVSAKNISIVAGMALNFGPISYTLCSVSIELTEDPQVEVPPSGGGSKFGSNTESSEIGTIIAMCLGVFCFIGIAILSNKLATISFERRERLAQAVANDSLSV
eukprot:snap_masked-scaffold_8-processed-gene-2.36-mRNA-1 protein AED:1.00 eAED:1.00 QI:0/0/0/0/1/1/2/0/211